MKIFIKDFDRTTLDYYFKSSDTPLPHAMPSNVKIKANTR